MRILSTLLLVTLTVAAAADEIAKAQMNWPSWRGPLLTGFAPQANPPVTWDESNHVKWRVAVPGSGIGSPVVWNDLVFLLTAVPSGENESAKSSQPPGPAPTPPFATSGRREGPSAPPGPPPGGPGGRGPGGAMSEEPTGTEQFTILAYDRATGQVRWQQTPRVEVPHEGHQKDNTYASASAVTDGEVVIAFFGSHGLYAYNLSGKLLWQKDLGRQRTRNGFGEGSSPALYGDTVIVVWDHEGDDFIVAFNKSTGAELWRKSRDENTNWSTPLILVHEGKPQVVVNSSNKVKSYDLASGEVLWEAGGQTANAIPTPVPAEGRVYVTSGFRGAAFQSIALGRKGDLTGTDAILWSHNKNTPYVPSALLMGDYLYFFAGNNAQLSILDAKDGSTQLDAERLDGIFGIYASPVGAPGRAYLTGRNGVVWVIKGGPKLEVLARAF